MRSAIERNSPYIAAVRRDVEAHAATIPALAAAARAAAASGSLAPVRECLARLEVVLSTLTDERAVLKHFDWPEAKARGCEDVCAWIDGVKDLTDRGVCCFSQVDAMREAVALTDECASLCAGLEAWRRAGGAEPAAPGSPMRAPAASLSSAAAPPRAGAPLAAVLHAAARALDKVQPRIEALVREQDGAHMRHAARISVPAHSQASPSCAIHPQGCGTSLRRMASCSTSVAS